MRNVYEVSVESCDRKDSYAWLKVKRCRLAARMWPGIAKGRKVRVSIRPEDVVLCIGHPGQTSARNILPGHVRSTRFVREGIEVEMDVGIPLVALLTRKGALELGIRKGVALFALVKATAVVPELDVRMRIRVSPVGERGLIEPARMDLLRAVDREGSLWKAAKTVGITYRTAWLWAKEINQAWGKPLLDRLHGGRGGGGTSLTPEGRVVLRETAAIEQAHSS